jgi:parvulin-like peptidyl-prolyl isomerase
VLVVSPDNNATSRPSYLMRWLREPLLQFLIVGIALFAGYRLLHPEVFSRDDNRIVLSEDDLRQMGIAWSAQGRSPPTPEQWAGLIDERVRQEILFREALALGLDKDDTIIKRRMVQKMDFLAEDVAAARDPDPAELRAWFDANSERFSLPPRVSFRHLYFSVDRRGRRAQADAAAALRKLEGTAKDARATTGLGDPFMFRDNYAERTPEQMTKEFGVPFARALFQAKPGSWQGPVESGYGWHLIWIDSLIPGRVPSFEEVEPEVKAEWIAEQQVQAKRKIYEAMRDRYVVVLPATIAPSPNDSVRAAPQK